MTQSLKPFMKILGPGSFYVETPDIDGDGKRDAIKFRVQAFAEQPTNMDICFRNQDRYLCVSEGQVQLSSGKPLTRVQLLSGEFVEAGQTFQRDDVHATLLELETIIGLDRSGGVYLQIRGQYNVYSPLASLPSGRENVPEVYPLLGEEQVTLKVIGDE